MNRPISICIIAKNEEKSMETFLSCIVEHAQGYPVEILIADTGSTDATIEIASRFPVRLIHFEWINDFAVARNFTLQQAANDWIFVLDCDEYIEALDKFLKATTFKKAGVEGANFFIPTYNLGCINEVLGDIETATALYKRCGNFKPALDRLATLNK